MIFKMVNSCPQNVDTIIRYAKFDAPIKFSCPVLQEAFDNAFGGDDLKLQPGTVKNLRLKVADKFVNLIIVGFDCSMGEKALDVFKKATLKVGALLNEMKSEVIFWDKFTGYHYTTWEAI